MATKKPGAVKRPVALNSADKKALSRILKKARAYKAFYKASEPKLIEVKASRKGAK